MLSVPTTLKPTFVLEMVWFLMEIFDEVESLPTRNTVGVFLPVPLLTMSYWFWFALAITDGSELSRQPVKLNP